MINENSFNIVSATKNFCMILVHGLFYYTIVGIPVG
jgi:hypothetical protein